MKVLIVGGGGREHAILWKLAQSSKVHKIYCAPGNAGTNGLAENVSIAATDIEALLQFAQSKEIDMTIVGMDDPLMLGIVDRFEEENLRIFGPHKAAALIEGSKVFAKDFMMKYNIPTAAYKVFQQYDEAIEYLDEVSYPVVVKADGLALGKGVLICNTYQEAEEALKSIMVAKKFGTAGCRVVIEEFMEGHEVSVLAFCDGNTLVPMVSAQDHKRAYDGDKGLNTGGMGTFSPSRYYSKDIAEQCMSKIFMPTIRGMREEGRPFKGILFFGLMLTKDGPKLLEYNARFGDPEAQVVLPRLKTPLVDIIQACIDGELMKVNVEWNNDAAVCIVCASGGYPVNYRKGYPISGLNKFQNNEEVIVFHAGTAINGGKVVTNGGRVLGVTAIGANLDAAINKSYNAVKEIYFEHMHYRNDIGRK